MFTKMSRFAKATRFAAHALATVGVVALLIGYSILELRWDAIEVATSHVSDVSAAMADGVANTIAAIDLALRDAVDVARDGIAGPTISAVEGASIQRRLKQRWRALPETDMIALANVAGDVVAGSSFDAKQKINVADRDYFKELAASQTDGLVISKPLASKLTGRMAIFFARRINSSEGAFLGVAIVAIPPEVLFRGHRDLAADKDKSYALFYADGTVALREPAASVMPGTQIDPSAPWGEISARDGGVFHVAGNFDGQPGYLAVHRVPGRPFFIDVGVSDNLALSSWRSRATTIVLSCIVALMLIATLLHSQFKLSRRLSSSKLRSWARAKRLAAREMELADSRERFGSTLDYISQGMAIFSKERKLVVANRSYAEIYDLRPEQLQAGMGLFDIYRLRIAKGAYAGADGDEYMRRVHDSVPTNRIDHLRNGTSVHVRGKPTADGGWITVQEDVTERVRVERELSLAARLDSLTQLPNRLAFREELARRLEAGTGDPFLVAILDIRDFNYVNDIYSHDVGDNVLIEIGRRLSATAPETYVARFGGDEFAALVTKKPETVDDAEAMAAELARICEAPVNLGGRRISLAMRVGAQIACPGEHEPECVMHGANLALYLAQHEARNPIRVFDDGMERARIDKLRLAEDLRAAIELDQLEVHYQPIVCAQNGDFVCMEALARWRHPTRGMVPPMVFIPLAEEIGLINELGDWILRRSCQEATLWRSDIVVAVNVSSLQIERPDYVETVAAALAQTGLPAARLQLEITETVLLQNNEQTRAHLLAIRAMGVTFALDDFGTGYASLSYLKAFPLDKIKIDKFFVDDICANPQSIAIVGAVVALATGIGVQTTAEGVETKEQAEALRMIGVATMQGYYFSKPKPIRDHDAAAIFNSNEATNANAA